MSNITVRKANVLLTVPDVQREEYLSKGFDVVDDKTNKVLEAALPRDVNALTIMVQKLQDEIKALKKENAELKQQLNSMAETVKETEEVEPPQEPEEVEEPEETKAFTPINKRKPKNTKG